MLYLGYNLGVPIVYTKGKKLSTEKPLKDKDRENILDRLDKLTFTGRISNSTIGLIVPFKLAFEEMSYYYSNLTEVELKKLLITNNIVILNKPDDLERYRAAGKTKRGG